MPSESNESNSSSLRDRLSQQFRLKVQEAEKKKKNRADTKRWLGLFKQLAPAWGGTPAEVQRIWRDDPDEFLENMHAAYPDTRFYHQYTRLLTRDKIVKWLLKKEDLLQSDLWKFAGNCLVQNSELRVVFATKPADFWILRVRPRQQGAVLEPYITLTANNDAPSLWIMSLAVYLKEAQDA